MRFLSIVLAALIGTLGLLPLGTSAAPVNMKTVAALYKDKATVVGKTISAQGKVVKVNNGIMGRNFVHVQDGTGDASSNNLIVTDTGANIKRLLEIISAIDTQTSTVAAVKVFQLKYASAAAAAKLIMEVFKPETGGQQQPNPGFFHPLDAARRIAGTGSLGIARYVILVEGHGSPNLNYLLDLKAAIPSSLQPYLKHKQPSIWHDLLYP